MAFLALVIGIILIVVAIRNSQAALFAALKTDVPDFAIWAAAIIAIGAIGFVPGLKPISRWLLALIIIVIVLRDYQPIITGFQNAWQGAQGVASDSAVNAKTASPTPSPSTGSTANPYGFTINPDGTIQGAMQ